MSFHSAYKTLWVTAITTPDSKPQLLRGLCKGATQYKLCRTCGFHGGDYEECRLLGYENPVRTSPETHYVSATEPSRLMLCKIRGFHGGDCEEHRPLVYKNPVRTSQETLRLRYRAQPANAG
jgi:hypothetical protein